MKRTAKKNHPPGVWREGSKALAIVLLGMVFWFRGADARGATGGYTVDYVIRTDWGTGATVDVTITNNGSAPINGWTLSWNFSGNQKITQVWNGTYTQGGTAVSVSNVSYNGTIGANGGIVSFGFNLSYSGNNLKPTIFILNNGSGSPVPPYSVALPGGGNCTVAYVIQNDWGTGATINVTIKNNGSTAVTGWTVKWKFRGDQTITNLWNGSYTQSGALVSVSNVSYNGTIGANGGTVGFGFNVNYRNSNLVPAGYVVNGKSTLNTATNISYSGVTIDVPAGVAEAGSLVSITPLSSAQMFAIPGNVPNATLGTAGYDISASGGNGSQLYGNVTISLKYDPSKLPAGMLEGGMMIYDYDAGSGQWQVLQRSGLDTTNHVVACATNHFCQMFAGGAALTGADAPENEGINTVPVNLGGADALAGIRGMAPPSFNNRGTAELSCPIELPAGINGLTPELAVNYSSGNVDGNCGRGWNLNGHAITLDIRKGAPKYDGSDRYLLDGKELVRIPGTDNFRLKSEGSFIKVDKEGAAFKAYQPDGRHFCYGEYTSSRLADPNNGNRVYASLLDRISDKSSNHIDYEYTAYDGNPYLTKISYGYNGAYTVSLEWEDRYDKREQGRYGFLVTDGKRLKRIVIYYNTSVILKQYEFTYLQGAFACSLLESIEEKNPAGADINQTSFEYDTDVSQPFSSTVVWPVHPLTQNNLGQPIFGCEDLRYTYTYKITGDLNAHDEIDLMDVNGDGLPDRVAKRRVDGNLSNRDFFVQYNTGVGFTNTVIMPPAAQFPAFSFDDKDLRLNYTNDSYHQNHTEIDLVDINGDGYPDRVAKHRDDSHGNIYVQFNKGDGSFTPNVYAISTGSLCPFGYQDLRYTYNDGATHTEIDFADMNGDGCPDRMAKHRDDNNLYIDYNQYSAGGGLSFSGSVAKPQVPSSNPYYLSFQDKDLKYVSTTIDDQDEDWFGQHYNGFRSHTELDLVDINGDGLPDKVYKRYDDGVSNGYWNNFYVQYNLGCSQDNNVSFSDTVKIGAPFLCHFGSHDLRFSIAYDLNDEARQSHTEVDFVDVNGDGLPDRVAKRRNDGPTPFDPSDGTNYCDYLMVQFNTGTHFYATQYFYLPEALNGNRAVEDLRYTYIEKNGDETKTHTEVDFVDMDGDGLPDRVAKHRDDPNFYIQFNRLGTKNLLKKVVTTTGSEIDLEYGRAYVDENHANDNYARKLVLSAVTVGKPSLQTTRTVLNYRDGIYDRVEREFRGFRKVTAVTQDQEKTNVASVLETTYLVGNKTGSKDYYGINDRYDQYLYGQVESVAKKVNIDGVEYLLSKEKSEYATKEVLTSTAEVKFVYPARKRVWIYDYNNRFLGVDENNGDLVNSEEYDFDTDAGLIKEARSIAYGDPHHDHDDVKTVSDYAVSADYWVSMVANMETIDVKNNQRIGVKSFGYDNWEEGDGHITEGYLTSERTWNNNGGNLRTSYTYDGYGNIKCIEKPDGTCTEKTVTVIGNSGIYVEEETRNPLKGLTETIQYDPYGRVRVTMNAAQDETRLSYDDHGRLYLVSETPNGGQSVVTKQFRYQKGTDSGGEPYWMVQAQYLNDEASGDYLNLQSFKDALGRSVQTKTEAVVEGVKGWVVSGYRKYDKAGRVEVSWPASTIVYAEDDTHLAPADTSGAETTYGYDNFGRLSLTNAPTAGGRLLVYNYYNVVLDTIASPYPRILYSIMTEAEDGSGLKQEAVQFKDLAGQNVRTWKLKKDGNMLVTNFSQDLHGYTCSQEGNVGKLETQLDSVGRTMWSRSSDEGKTAYTYNGQGLVETERREGLNESDGVREQVTYQYYPSTDVEFADYGNAGENVSYEYYGADEANLYARSQVKKITKNNNTVEHEYGYLWTEQTKMIEGKSYTTRYEYDRQGRIVKLTYPDGEVVSYSYNEGGLLSKVGGDQVYVEEIRYNKFGQRTYVKYGNGTEMTYNYDPNDQSLDIFSTRGKNGEELVRYDYNFDGLGNLTSVQDSPNGNWKSQETYQYDSFSNRLASMTGSYYADGVTSVTATSFSCDDDDRLLQKKVGGYTADYTEYYPGRHAVKTINTPTGSIGFVYDDFGNMKSKTYSGEASRNQSYEYDLSDHLTKVTGDKLALTFSYDHRGRRLKKTYSDGVAVIKETVYVNGLYTVSQGQADKHYSDGLGIIATKPGGQAADIQYYHKNHLGSNSLVTDANGEKMQYFLFYPYGETWITEGSNQSKITRLFTGREYDEESGLYYYNARYYDPALGVFLSTDPAVDGFNQYAYCKNNPVRFTDPTGCFALGAGVVFSWDPKHGFGIGGGAALDFSLQSTQVNGVNASCVYNFSDQSTTTSVGAGAACNIGIVAIDLGVGGSYDSRSGWAEYISLGGSVLNFGLQGSATFTQGGTTGTTWRLAVKGYLGNPYANVGGGYEWGSEHTGWFNEETIGGFRWRDGALSWRASCFAGMIHEGRLYDFSPSIYPELGQSFAGLTKIVGLGYKILYPSDVTLNEAGAEIRMDMGSAYDVTIGALRFYRPGCGPDENRCLSAGDGTYYPSAGVVEHAHYHTIQYGRYGLYFLVYSINPQLIETPATIYAGGVGAEYFQRGRVTIIVE
jgi:RHS repeat-associated protein